MLKKLSKRNKRETIEDLFWTYYSATQEEIKALRTENRELMSKVESILPQLQDFMKAMPMSPAKVPVSSHTISEVLESMLFKGNNCKSEQIRKRNTIVRLLNQVGLNVEDDYSKFHDIKVIESICRNIVEPVNVKGDMKRKLIRYIKELATCGSNMDSDNYKTNIISNLPKVEKTKKAERNHYIPYTKDQLLEIFDPKHAYFKDNPDAFFACLIALYTGARANGALTIQYNDVMIKEGINCIEFVENHPIKDLKTDASERIVPIHPQLIDIGFVDYVRRNEKRLNAKGTDFIFPKCQTKSGKWNNKYTVRNVLAFFKSIGIKTGSKDGLAFHSFRKNASLALQEAGVIPSYINDIIGWDGKSTMEKYYSGHTLGEINNEVSKFGYDYLKPHFAKWKAILAGK